MRVGAGAGSAAQAEIARHNTKINMRFIHTSISIKLMENDFMLLCERICQEIVKRQSFQIVLVQVAALKHSTDKLRNVSECF